MKLSCCWIYAISKYGYPPTFDDTVLALKDMKKLGFKYVELEGVGRENMTEVHTRRSELKAVCDDLGLKVVNFAPYSPTSYTLTGPSGFGHGPFRWEWKWRTTSMP